MAKPIVEGAFLLERFPGKGGWTFARLPGITGDKSNPFGWRQVRGTVDSFELKQYKLMPMGDGSLFLPVRAEIRKKIKKVAGDTVTVVLYEDDSKFETPEEISICLDNEPPELREFYNSMKDWEKKMYIDWIYKAKREATRVQRITEMMDKLAKKQKFYEGK